MRIDATMVHEAGITTAGFFVLYSLNMAKWKPHPRLSELDYVERLNDEVRTELELKGTVMKNSKSKKQEPVWQNVYVPVDVKRRIIKFGAEDVLDYTAGLAVMLGCAESVLVKVQPDGAYKAFVFWQDVLGRGISFAMSQTAKKPEHALYALVWAFCTELDAGKDVEVDISGDGGDELDF